MDLIGKLIITDNGRQVIQGQLPENANAQTLITFTDLSDVVQCKPA